MRFTLTYIAIIACFFATSSEAQNANNQFHAGELYVKLKSHYDAPTSIEPSANAQRFFDSYKESFGITKVRAGFYFAKDDMANIYHVYFQEFHKSNQFIQALLKSEDVEYAEQIPISKHFDYPNDLGTNSQGANGQYYLYKINAPLAWDIQQGNPNIKVAVVDDALETTHSELSGFTLPGYDAVYNDFDVEPPSNDWDHGTFISGMIAAKTNNGEGMASLARGVRILPVKITDDNNANIILNEYEGVIYAASQGANVINMSWGSTIPSQTGLAAMNSANNAGIVLVAAAGNENTSLVTYPAAYPNVISVAATTSIDTKASFSNYGSWIDISSPGSQIWSLLTNNSYGVKSGTSFAAPLVSAAAALLLSNNPSLTPAQILACLKSSADNIDIFNAAYVGQLGAGRLNVQQALQCVLSSESAFDIWLAEVITPLTTSCNHEVIPQIRVVNIGLDTIFSMTIRSQLDNGFALDYSWTGMLLPNDATIITLPSFDQPIGNHQLDFRILDILNSSDLDSYPSNNAISHSFYINPSTGYGLPFVENFESGSFSAQNWTIVNQGTDFSWEIANTTGTSPGSKSARLPYFLDFETNARDCLITPTLNFSGFSNVSLSFDYAYMERIAGVTDSLIVLVSSDCGVTWNRVWERGEGMQDFTTAMNTGSFFTPSSSADWCGFSSNPSCAVINLTGLDGQTGIRLRFEGWNGNGNNIYIDNINVSGTPINLPPIADFDADGNLEACVGETVYFNNSSLNSPIAFNWSFPGANVEVSTSAYATTVYDSSGIYSVQLIATNSSGIDTLLLSDYITVIDVPSISVIFEPDTICRGKSATLRASGADLYFWNAAPSLPATYADSVIVNPTNTTTFTVTGWQQTTCTASTSFPLIVIDPPAAPVITYSNNELISTLANAYQWFVNGAEIDTATNQTLIPPTNGNYNVRAFDAFGCSSISIPFMITDVSIESLSSAGFSIQPNPASSLVKINAPQPILRSSIYDINGKIVQAVDYKENNRAIELGISNLANGFYFVGLSTMTTNCVLRLIVQH